MKESEEARGFQLTMDYRDHLGLSVATIDSEFLFALHPMGIRDGVTIMVSQNVPKWGSMLDQKVLKPAKCIKETYLGKK